MYCRARGGASEPGPVDKFVSGVKSFFGMEKKEEKPEAPIQTSPLGDFGRNLPLPLQLAGALIKPLFGLMGGLLKDSQSDIQSVLDVARSAIRRSGRCGPDPQCGAIMGQSYSSMSVNGQKSAQVQLQFQVQGEGRTYPAACSAVITSGGVELRSLQVEGYDVDTRGPSGSSAVIDVER